MLFYFSIALRLTHDRDKHNLLLLWSGSEYLSPFALSPPKKKKKHNNIFIIPYRLLFLQSLSSSLLSILFFSSFFKGLMCCRISLKPELCLKTPNGAILTTGTFEQLTGEIWWPWCTIRFLFCFFPIEFFFGEIHSISPSLITRGSTPNRGRNFYLISYRQQLSIQTLRFFF